ncbi:MAG: hypothetical protein WCO63_06925 [Bacteroidota bacterium]
MNFTKYILSCSFLILFSSLYAQDSPSNWRAYYGGEGLEQANAIEQLPIGGYIIAGKTNSKQHDITMSFGRDDAWVLRIDSSGNLLWQVSLGQKNDDEATCIAVGSTGNIAVAGYSTYVKNTRIGHHGGKDVYFALLDISGHVLQQHFYGGSGAEGACSIQATLDGGYFIAATTDSKDGDVTGLHGNSDIWIIRIDSVGKLLWQKCYGGTKEEQAVAIQETYNGQYIITAYSKSSDGDVKGNKGKFDYYWFEIDTAGVVLMSGTRGGKQNDKACAGIPTWDNGFLLAGSSTSNNGDVKGNHGKQDYWLIKLDSAGKTQWQQCIGGSKDDVATGLVQTYEGGYAMCGYTWSHDKDISQPKGKCDFWIVKIDSVGKLEWEASIGDSSWNVANCIAATSDWGLIVGGFSESRKKDFSNVSSAPSPDGCGNNCAEAACAAGFLWVAALTYDLLKPRLQFRDVWIVKF